MNVIRTAATLALLRDGTGATEVLLLQRPDRGAFPGGWVFPGGKVEASDEVPGDAEATARIAAVRETAEETGLIIAPESLVPISHWSPPAQLDTKFLTWFFVAEAPPGEVVPQPDEVVAHEWIRPADALKRHGAGDLRLFPPTWVTLDTLMAYPTVEAARRGLSQHALRTYETKQDSARGLAIWHGDEGYEGQPDTEDGPRHRLHVGALPWRFEHR